MVVDNQLIRFYELIELNKTQEAEIEIVKLLANNGDITIRAAQDAINAYNLNHPFSRVDISRLEKQGLRHKSYLHQLISKMRDKAELLDDVDKHVILTNSFIKK